MLPAILKRLRQNKVQKARRRCSATLRLELLEDRRVLASNLGMIEGIVYDDLNSNGVIDTGETGLSGVTVQISGGALGSPMTDVTDSSGAYSFSGLDAGTYMVEQVPPPPTGYTPATGASPQTVTISAAQAMGRQGMLIDDFNGTAQDITAENPATAANPNPNSGSVADSNAIGGTRDLTVESLSNPGRASILSDIPGNPGVLAFDPMNNSAGSYTVVWDADNDPSTLMATGGFGSGSGIDLTEGGLSDQFQMLMGVQGLGQEFTVRVFTDSDSVSEITADFPNSLMPDQEVLLSFSDFSQAGTAGVNSPADFTEIRAIELLHSATVIAADGSIDFAQLLGPSVQTVNFANIGEVDVQVEKTVNDTTPNVGDLVTFTVTTTNNGPGTASDIMIQDVLPSGLTLTSSSPSQGTYTSDTGLWDVGTLAAGASVTLQLEAQVDVTSTIVNTASLSSLNEVDMNSANNTASATLSPKSVDLGVTKSVNTTAPFVDDTITFSIAVTNNGPSNATGVVYEDILPTGLTFVNYTSSQGVYDSGTGLWTVGAIANGGTASLNVSATVDSATSFVNTVQLSDVEETDTVEANNMAQVQLVGTSRDVNLSVQKSVDDTTPVYNQTVTYNVSVTNEGPIGATNVRIDDDLPDGVNFVSSNATQGIYDSSTGIWNVGSLASGESAQLAITARVFGLEQQVNTATLNTDALDQVDTNATDNVASVSLLTESPSFVGKRAFFASSFRV